MPEATLELGRLYRAKVSKIVPNLELAFVDLGATRHAVLHQVEQLREGQEILVRISQLPVNMKGAVVTQVETATANEAVLDVRPHHPARQLSWQQQLFAAALIAGSFSVIWWLQP